MLNLFMRNRFRTCIVATVASLVVGTMFNSAIAEDIRKQQFRFASAQVAEHPFSKGAQKFADLIDEKSAGKMKARLFAGGTMGGDAEVITSLQGGTLDGTFVSTGLIAPMDKNFGIFYLPMVFDSAEEADKVVDSPFGQKMLERLEPHGLVGLTYWEHGFREASNSKLPIMKLEDYKGLKLRVIQIPIFVDIYKSLGVNPVPISFTEVYTALEQKAVDGQETALPTFQSARFDEVQKYLSQTQITYDPLVVLFSKKTWDKLNSAEQEVVRDAALEATDYQRNLNRQTIEEVITSSRDGFTVSQMPQEERERVRAHLQPLIKDYSKDLDPEIVMEFWEEVSKAKSN